MLKIVKTHKIVFLFLWVFMTSCDENRLFDEYQTLPKGAWDRNDTLVFAFKVTDTLTKHNLYINLRNNNNYPFNNLFVITCMQFPDHQKIMDTLEYDMTDNTGRFLGSGFTEIKENKLFYKEHITFPIAGDYTFKVIQSMRKNGKIDGVEALDGVTDVGFRVEKIQ